MITFSSPLTFDYALAKATVPEGIDLATLIDRIGRNNAAGLTIDEAIFGRGQFVSKTGDDYLFGWSREGGLRVIRSRSYAPMIRWTRLYGSLKTADGRVFKMHATAYASGNIILNLSLKMNYDNVKSAAEARAKSVDLNIAVLPAVARGLRRALGLADDPSFAVMNASMSGSTRRTFAKNMYYFPSTVAAVKGYLETIAPEAYIVVPIDSIEGPPRPYTFRIHESETDAEVARYFTSRHPPRGDRTPPALDPTRPSGFAGRFDRRRTIDRQKVYGSVTLTPLGAKKFPEVRDERRRGDIDAFVDFRTGNVRFMKGAASMHFYESIFVPRRVVDVLIWNTGSIQITGSDDFNFGFLVYATLDAHFERDAATMFIGTNAPPKNRAPVERRGANRRPTERGRSGRREGTTCKPPDRIPIPGNFEGACPAGMHVRPNAQGFPCCFKDVKSTAGIRKAYLQAKIPIPQRLIARYPDLAGAGPAGPAANRNRNAPAVGVDAKGRLLLNRKICARQPVQIIEAAVAAMGVSTTRSPSPRKGQVVKKTRAEMCGDVQFLRLPELDLRIINDDLEALRAFIRGFGKIAEDMPTPDSRQAARALITSILAARTGATTSAARTSAARTSAARTNEARTNEATTNEARTNEARTNEARSNEARSTTTRSSASGANLLRNLENAFANVVPPTVRVNNVVPPTVRTNSVQKTLRANNVQKTVRANKNLLRNLENAFANENKPAPRPAPKPAPRPAPKPAPRPAKPAPKPKPTTTKARNMAQPPAAKPRLVKRPAAAAAAKPRPMLNIAGTRPSAVPERPFVARKRPVVVEYDDMPNINFDPLKDIFKNINKSVANINVPQPQQPKPQPQPQQPKTQPQQPKTQPQQPKTQPQQPKSQPQQPKSQPQQPKPQPQQPKTQRNDFRKLKRNYDILNRIFGFR